MITFNNLRDAIFENTEKILLPTVLGIVLSYVITVVAAYIASGFVVPIMLLLLAIIGGLGLLYGLFSIYVLVPAGCAVAHLLVITIILRRTKPDSIFRSRFFVIGYSLYFVLAIGLTYSVDDILRSHAPDRPNVVYSDQRVQTVTELSVYLPARFKYTGMRTLGLVKVPSTTDRCLPECVRILSESGVQAVVIHRERIDQERPHPLGHQSHRFTYSEREGCRAQDRRPANWVFDACIVSEPVPYSPRQGLYVDVQRSSEAALFVTTIEAVLHLKYADGENVSEIATFRSGVSEPSDLLKALRYPFHMLVQAGTRGHPDRVTFGTDLGLSRGTVSPMYALLEYLGQKDRVRPY